ncbi:hypothetical protein OAT71_00140 [Flavobacteriales bacterium]|jgi:hypothetical protein|nr:hypothetical protein [Flavobacteriales bacterium]
MEAGKKRLNGDTQREAYTEEVHGLERDNHDSKKYLTEIEMGRVRGRPTHLQSQGKNRIKN